MDIRAAILWEQGQPLSLEPAALDAPGPGDVLVEVKAAGVCHSDLHAANGDWPMRVPLVLGHEGAGIVREVGAHVTHLVPGDRVVLCWAPPCGRCPPCLEGRPVLCDRLEKTTFRNKLPGGGTHLRARDRDVAPFLGTACFADHVVVPGEGAIRIEDDMPFESLAALGCAVVTGVGAVLNAARVPAGATVAVIGAGGVGLNVVQGAVIAGCARIIAVDRQAAPLALATALGATDIVQDVAADAGSNRERKGTTDAIRERTGGRGADYVFDTVGTPATLADALTAARKGGTVVLTGLSRVDGLGSLPMFPFVMQEKRLIGSAYGSGQPLRDIPRLAALHQQGRLKLREIATRTYALDQINDALGALAAGQGGRGIVRL
jgi:S-(hydroxymethyl)glutathione dehydrogenase/alcohol dehydrogenase